MHKESAASNLYIFLNTPICRRGDAKEEVSKLLGDPSRVFTTKCVMHELRGLGKDYITTRQACKRYALHKCGHEDPVSAAQCLAEQVVDGNHEHFFIATQDRALQRQVINLPGGAVLFTSVNGIHIETPSEAQKRHVQAKEVTGVGFLPLSTKKKVRKDGSDGFEDEEGSSSGEEKEAQRQRPPTGGKFRRNIAKGPNPLSMQKKKKKRVDTAGVASRGVPREEAVDGEEREPRAKRQRRRRTTGGDLSNAEEIQHRGNE
jgi:U3 small nucleolar RNA-associated protein 23